MVVFTKQEIAIVKWYNEQINRAREEKDGNRVIQLEKEIRSIGMDIRKSVLNRNSINNTSKQTEVLRMGLPKDCMLYGFADKLTDEQKIYVDSIFDNQVTIVNAKAGTGKTTLAVACASLLDKPLVYIFAPVEEGKMGFRPGDQQEKESEYYQPLIDALYEIGHNPTKVMYDAENQEALKRGDVWVYPRSHIFARGTNIKDSVVIISEAQNFTRGELKKVLTRIHDSCTVIIEGHDGQNDLPDPKKSGFVPYIEHLSKHSFVNVVSLTKNFRGRLSTVADELTW